ncbi:uncharacterized protein LOC122954532 [Acropora millepora]|uniref:uncharacterized protein LOC122954532 n=1 Tax=Acropora millepora TaxID=45264 RepID=UPI001CF4EB4D|nr:uncharacterized protein LOC122954532 [Acropora millepora]
MCVDRRQLDHFINFITSGHLIQDLPFGEKRLKLTSGKEIKVPNIIRTMTPQRVAEQYTAFCQETEFLPFSKRTMLRVLSECSTSVRKSLQGLDSYAAEGVRAFDDLAGIVENISTNVKLDAKKTEVLDALKAGKRYLKGECKVHTSSSSEVADHRSVHALSDLSDKDLSEECDHQHDQRCSQCDALDNVLVHIENLVPSADFYNKEDKDEASYLCRTFVNAIHSWKSHHLRSVHQDLGPVSRKSRELFGPEKPFIKLRAAYSVKPVF